MGPVAAELFASNKHGKLGTILVQSNRLVGFISALLLIPLLVYIKPLLKIWLELTDRDGTVCAIILLLSMYFLVFFRSSSVQVLLMCNKHKALARIAAAECLLNLALSIVLIRYIGIIGVALGTLIPNVVLGLAYNIRAACKFSNLSLAEYFKQSILKTLAIGGIVFAVAYGLYVFRYPETFLAVFLYSVVVCIIYVLLFYLFALFAVYGWEKKQLKEFIRKKLKARQVTNAANS